MAPPHDLSVSIYATTDVGLTREHNEDAFLVADLAHGEPLQFERVIAGPSGPRGTLFMVADGMGGAAAGEIASEMAVEVVRQEMGAWGRTDASQDPVTFVIALKHATEQANAAIHRFAVEHPEFRGMGTTATIAGLLGDTLYLAQVGDSRAYLVRDGHARQITKDQSLMQKLIEAGEISVEEAEQSERRNIILQALGPELGVKIDLTHQRVRSGDVLVLCSDGLSGVVRPEQIARAVTEERDLDTAAERLVEMANDAGGPDNITVVMARFDGRGFGTANSGDEVGHHVFRGPGIPTPLTPPTAMPAASLADAVTEEIERPWVRPTPKGQRTIRRGPGTPPNGAVVDVPDATAVPATPDPATPPLSPADVGEDERRRRGRRYVRIIAGVGAALVVWFLWRVMQGMPQN
jgi:serine/threonine protein phosphatase PrpC